MDCKRQNFLLEIDKTGYKYDRKQIQPDINANRTDKTVHKSWKTEWSAVSLKDKEKNMDQKGKNMDQNRKVALVTGASSGIGFAISEALCKRGYQVYGIGRNFDTPWFLQKEWREESFRPVICDMLQTEQLLKIVRQIMAEQPVNLLINNAGAGYYGLHEELNPEKIMEMVRVNLEAPMLLCRELLRSFMKIGGTIINISSVTAAETNPHGCAYGATKAGLANFTRSLFEESRKYGVRVAMISPDMTRTNLYRNADFEQADEAEAYLLPEEVAQAVEFVLDQRDGMVVSEIVLKPQLHRIKRKSRDGKK